MSQIIMDSSNLDQESTIFSVSIPKVNYVTYQNLKAKEDGRKIIINAKGDVDTINIIESPEFYGMNLETAFSMLEKDGKVIGASIIYRFENKNTLEEIKKIIREFY